MTRVLHIPSLSLTVSLCCVVWCGVVWVSQVEAGPSPCSLSKRRGQGLGLLAPVTVVVLSMLLPVVVDSAMEVVAIPPLRPQLRTLVSRPQDKG